ncbi:MAG TPA: alpha/beta fold hydrolase, partial [Variovorax sp.]|nr:alpha/beta fold hydrolase [Variovorax sp.]
MPTRPFEFLNPDGHRLSGSLEMPEGIQRGWALFAHCFTCGKNNLAAVRIARTLASVGIGVLRFDFTGLGDTEGSFADASFSLNVQDLVSAADAMEAAGMPPRLLIGHSLGGK